MSGPWRLPTSASPAEWVAYHARERPGAPAVDSPEVRLTYAALHDRVERLAGDLAARGVATGDRVLVALPPGPAAAVAALAVQALGGCAVEIDRAMGEAELRDAVAQTGARHALLGAADARRWRAAVGPSALAHAWIVGGRPGDALEAAAAATPLARDGLPGPGATGAPPPGRAEPPGDAAAAIVFTSGSTGRPRGVIQTFRNVSANTRSIVSYLALGPADRAMAILPFHYCYGKSVLQTHLLVGGSVFVDPRFMYPRVVMEAIGAERCTGFAGVPTTFELLRREVDVASVEMPSLRYATQAGGPLRAETLRWAKAAFAPARLVVMYGQTEATARLAWLPPERLDEKAGSIGIPIPGVELAVADDGGAPVGPGEVGHLLARGENVTPGYLGAPEETARILRGGWLWTGDLARRDADGFFWLEGRAREILKVGGHRVSPLEIERVLESHPAVAEALVAGVPDPLQGEMAVAFVVARAGADAGEPELRRFCRDRLAPHKVPARVVAVREIPRNAAGKPQRAAQVARWIAERGGE